ncbi:Hypothetical predicted protein [Pelobates cultripes]|uniref:Uncharacterized protein n=1 Tax=Pelobates cultripes TaxID=61616 RepID=A0AAD1SZV6_PELCU|nr:Hypothetical predicted protein [Pelobates cultripes]
MQSFSSDCRLSSYVGVGTAKERSDVRHHIIALWDVLLSRTAKEPGELQTYNAPTLQGGSWIPPKADIP